ncbi:hypothetical protein [Lentzea albidocapillata]|uniref:hypothetical protein n=1 Tax=Lentzea albidocapillata TaxID=40571 RepID=UPI00115FA720|nr:hypothetical protein [Lentzea albidocapillata]
MPAVSAAAPLRVQILLYEGVEELDSIAPFDVLSIAATMGGAIQTTLVSITKPTTVTASRGLRMEAPRGWSPARASLSEVDRSRHGRRARDPGCVRSGQSAGACWHQCLSAVLAAALEQEDAADDSHREHDIRVASGSSSDCDLCPSNWSDGGRRSSLMSSGHVRIGIPISAA